MTAVMRAARPTGPRVLRIGLLSGGRILEERIVKNRASVTVGPGERCTFVVAASVPPRFELFERAGDDYYLNVLPGMSGRVALPSGIADVASLAASNGRVRLDEQSRGKMVLGDTTLLFQFVAPPPLQNQPRLPLSVKEGILGQIDWTLAVIAAFSFLLHFGLVGGMYSDWMDTVAGDDLTVGLMHLVQPPAAIPVDTTDAPTASATPTETAPVATPAPTGATPARTASRADRSPDPAAADGLLHELTRLDVDLIGSTTGGPNLRRVMLAGPEGAPVDLDALWNRQTRIGTRVAGSFDLPGGSEPIQPGVHQLDLHAGETGAPTSVTIARVIPPFDVHEDRPTISAPIANAEATIRNQIHPGARRCYQTGLGVDANQSGKLMLLIRVGPSGEVQSASVTSNTGLSPTVAGCIVSVAQRAKFDPPGPGGATILVPFGFLKQ